MKNVQYNFRLLFSAFTAVFVVGSCTVFFSTSLASWAKRDTDGLLPPVTAGNVRELIDMAGTDPAMSLSLLGKIGDAVNGSSGDVKAGLQAAALKAAANAVQPAQAVLKHAGSLTEINDSGEAVDLFNKVLGDMKNLTAAADLVTNLLPANAVPGDNEFDRFAAASDPQDLAMIAAVIFAADAVKSGDSAAYLTGYTTGGSSDLAEALAQAALDKVDSGEGDLGLARSLLEQLGLTI
jgi:hypothetical protein